MVPRGFRDAAGERDGLDRPRLDGEALKIVMVVPVLAVMVRGTRVEVVFRRRFQAQQQAGIDGRRRSRRQP